MAVRIPRNIENGHIQIRVKATDHARYYRDTQTIACPVEMAHLWSWAGEPCPVILVRYDATADRGYWLYVQREWEGASRQAAASPSEDAPANGDQAQEKATLRIPLANRLDCEAVMRFRALLAQLRFVDISGESRWKAYRQGGTDITILLANRAPDLPARPADLVSVRRHLVDNGVLDQREFERLLS